MAVEEDGVGSASQCGLDIGACDVAAVKGAPGMTPLHDHAVAEIG